MKHFMPYVLLYIAIVGLLIFLHLWLLLGCVIFFGIICGYIIAALYVQEAGFRVLYPMDFLMRTNWLNNYFYTRGFDILEYDTKDSNNPQTILRKDCETVKVRLNAPLMSTSYYYEIITEGSNNLFLKFPVRENQDEMDKIKEELDKYFGEYPIVREQNPEMRFYGNPFVNNRPIPVE